MVPFTNESNVQKRAEKFYGSILAEQDSIFNRGHWIGKTLAWCMKNPEFKIQLFRFIDVFPSLGDSHALTRHLREYFSDEYDIPDFFKRGAKVAAISGFVGDYLLNKAIGKNIHAVARQFIVGETLNEALTRLHKIREQGFGFTLDLLGEAVVSEEEADKVFAVYSELIEALNASESNWNPLGTYSGAGNLDWGSSPKINVSVKPSAFYSQIRPENFEGSVEGVLSRLENVFENIIQLKGFMCIDMESYASKEISFEIYRRLRLQHPDYPYLGIAIQSYLRDTDEDLRQLLTWASDNSTTLSIRLVKGAYWDYELGRARRNNWPVPVYTQKAETDAAFERHARLLLENHTLCHLASASHNIRSIAYVLETAEELCVPPEQYEFQVLYGMAEPIARELAKEGQRVRLYAPFGEMVPGMAYLVRRLLENTSNQSFLRQLFVEEAAIGELIKKPEAGILENGLEETPESGSMAVSIPPAPFKNEPVPDFSKKATREDMKKALEDVQTRLGKNIPLFIDGREITTENLAESNDPAFPDRIVGRVSQGGASEAQAAVDAAKKAFPDWNTRTAKERAEHLLKAAKTTRKRYFELAAWQVFEVGKQWEQACADVSEGIDFLEYYARQMVDLEGPLDSGSFFGENNHILHEGKGVSVVIAPWNFPMAISIGMVSAALVAGNTVIYKPSERSPVIGALLNEILQKTGLPPGVLNFLPGDGKTVGTYLVEHPEVCLIAFTGSMKVGLEIIEKAGKVSSGQVKIKKVIAEMGGKNAIIIDDDADLDEAVPAVLHSAFGFQGQKCSACSRVIVLEAVYERFVERLVSAARSLKIGPAEDPGNFMGPVIDERAREKILEYIASGQDEATLLFSSETPAGGSFVPLTIFGEVQVHHRIAQEEIFGPVLAVMKTGTFQDALDMANSTPFALTGGVFSRSPFNLELARKGFQVGNLYINRGITGALVERQPFGGYRLSGLGSKAGGRDYLLNFLETRSISENTLRRGFAPDAEE
jgi:RHH-type transcriptional regulator, proline utilization regulon repressor / proline dehydrogenase / delta 1-pyrroline-5-carboxylate dehydrogenase